MAQNQPKPPDLGVQSNQQATDRSLNPNTNLNQSRSKCRTRQFYRPKNNNGNPILTELRNRLKMEIKAPLGRRLDFKTITFEDAKRDLLNQWKLTGSVQIIPWIKGYFVIKLDNEDDRKRVSYNGPWKTKQQQLKVQPWTPMFDPESEKVTKAAVWVRFNYPPWEFWDEETLFRMARGFG
ncbi:uncharacterized protein LOC113272729 [Papaver somniferum]|uniref:uncharacterized protein LOC113272729 n=1 Tax=Papaver somniferum TaxID=3469 RepID=UPI000E6F5B5A|nr:uncharacterized protein LOC113272729 [Papaver somniferum]